ncbi:MAG: alpha/beta fold hydrolase [Dehalococcoidia bacterium]|nr:alpha/beta fold hydrolase [Dehalococcoidia bacterium]MSQ17690.1 alpha/beta fold hydrolase [Dehalococcoidia bacterium]
MPQPKYLTIDGIKVNYVQEGQGPAVLLLHGLGTSLVTWAQNIQPLAAAGYRVVALDLPGHGDSDKPRHLSYDPAAGARLVRRALHALGVERASLVGNSAGGLIVGMYALAYPTQVERLVLVSAGGLGRQVAWFLRMFSLPGVGELLYQPQWQSGADLSRRIFYQVPGQVPGQVPNQIPSQSPSFLDQVLPEMCRVRSLPGSRRATLRALRSSVNLFGQRRSRYILPSLRQLAAPVLTVWGEEDNILPVRHAEAVRLALPGSLVHTMPQCGHWPHMERPEEFNQLLVRFLSGELDSVSRGFGN